MRIGIDTSALFLSRAGTATYIRGLLKGFQTLSKKTEIIQLFYIPRFDRHNRYLRIYDTIKRELIWMQERLPKEAVRKSCEIIHGPAMMSPIRCQLPIVLTIFDLYIVRNKQSFPFWPRTFMNYILPKIINSSSRIIAISQFTKQEILDLFPKIPESKIMVTPLGVDPIFNKVLKEATLPVKSKYGLVKPFIITVSTIEPRKNFENLLRSYALVKNYLEHDLVVVGSYGWKSTDIMTLIHQLKLEQRVKYMGYVDKTDLPALYSAADIFVYPSLYEGFGLPPLEAMACGCPIITSNCSSLPEVVGDAAMLINPTDIEQLSQALKKLAGDVSKKELLRVASLKRAQAFSWDKCAQMTIRAYEQAIGL